MINSRVINCGVNEKNEMYQNEHCEGCPFKSQCTKSKTGRTIQRCRELESYKKEVKENLSTEQGKTYMTQRSIWSEGIFGQIKDLDRSKKTIIMINYVVVAYLV